MTYEEKFSKISAKFSKAETSILTTEFAIQVNLTDADCGGAFYIANIGGVFSVEPYDYHDHTSMLTVTADDFNKIIAGKLSIDNGIANGRFEIEGNVDDIRILPGLFPKSERKTKAKAPAKETKKCKK